MTFHGLRSVILGSILVAACDGTSPVVPTPTSPSPGPPSPSRSASSLENWRASATVVLVTGPGAACGWGVKVGDARTDVAWRITITGESILLEEDMANWPTDHTPFSGTLRGPEFVATYTSGDDYLRWACQFKGGTLRGSFSEDFSTFEGLEELTWGPPDNETTVHRRWTGWRLPTI